MALTDETTSDAAALSGNNVTPQSAPPKPAPSPPSPGGDLSYAGVDSSMTVYLTKNAWLIIISLVIMVALFYFPGTAFGIILPLLALAYLRAKYENSLFAAFASANNFSFVKSGTPDWTADGIVFSLGHDRGFSDLVTGAYKGLPCHLCLYKYTIGYGRGAQHYDRAIMNAAFGAQLPPFVLGRHHLLQGLEAEGESLGSAGYTQKVSLEGDFDKHFQLYIRPGTQDGVLSVLTPDVMQVLANLDKYELEMTASGNFYVYCYGYISKKQSLIDMYAILESVMAPIARYAKLQHDLASRAAASNQAK